MGWKAVIADLACGHEMPHLATPDELAALRASPCSFRCAQCGGARPVSRLALVTEGDLDRFRKLVRLYGLPHHSFDWLRSGPDDPPPGPEGGTREPRRPHPDGGASGVALLEEIFGGPEDDDVA
jgi:hypothetical protein